MGINYQAAVNITATFQGQQAVDQARRSFDSVDKAARGLSSGLALAARAIPALAAAFAIREVAQFAGRVVNLGDSLNDLRQKTGIGVQALSDLKAAAEDGGVDFGALEGSLKKFSVTLAKAGAGSEQAQAGFRALGVSFSDVNGKARSSEDVLLEIADKFSRLEDSPQKAAAAVALFGKTGADLIPLLNGGRDAIEGMGVQMSDEFAKQSDKFNDNLNSMKRGLSQLGVSIGEFVLPKLNSMFDSMATGWARLKNADWSKLGSVGLVGILSGQAETRSPADLKRPENYNATTTVKKSGKIDTRFLSKNDNGSENKLADKIKREYEALKKYQEAEARDLELEALKLKAIDMSTVAYEQEAIAIKMRGDAARVVADFEPETRAEYLKSTEELIKHKQALVEVSEQQKKSFGNGAKAAFREYADAAGNTAAQFKNLFGGALRGVEDAMVNFVKTGKLSFSDLVSFIEEALIRIAVQKTIAFGLNAAFGGAGAAPFAMGGVMTESGPRELRRYANGGVANSPQLALFGEGSRPEAYVPLPDGRTIPVTMKGGQAGGMNSSVVVNVNIANGSATSEDSSGTEAFGKMLGERIVTTCKGVILNELRPGGMLA